MEMFEAMLRVVFVFVSPFFTNISLIIVHFSANIKYVEHTIGYAVD